MFVVLSLLFIDGEGCNALLSNNVIMPWNQPQAFGRRGFRRSAASSLGSQEAHYHYMRETSAPAILVSVPDHLFLLLDFLFIFSFLLPFSQTRQSSIHPPFVGLSKISSQCSPISDTRQKSIGTPLSFRAGNAAFLTYHPPCPRKIAS